MRIIGSVEDQEVIKINLNHLGLWLIRSKPAAKAHAPPVREYAVVDIGSNDRGSARPLGSVRCCRIR
jgi:hypothetical protein